MSGQANTKLHIDVYERNWMIISIVLLVVFVTAVSIAGFMMGINVPAPQNRVNPNTVAKEGPFATPGLRELGGGKYEAYILAGNWKFDPKEMSVPVGSSVTFYITSSDVQHGFKLASLETGEATNLNVQVVPGQVSKLTIKLDKPGTYQYICTEYCGGAHPTMFGTLTVTP